MLYKKLKKTLHHTTHSLFYAASSKWEKRERHLCINTKWRSRKMCWNAAFPTWIYRFIDHFSLTFFMLCIFKCQTKNDLKIKRKGKEEKKKKFIKKHYFIFIHKTCSHTLCLLQEVEVLRHDFLILDMCLLQTTQQCMLFRLNKFKFSPLSLDLH